MLYTYICDECTNEIEFEHPMAESPIVLCPKCNSKMHIKIFGGSEIIIYGGTRNRARKSKYTHEQDMYYGKKKDQWKEKAARDPYVDHRSAGSEFEV